MYSWLVWSLAMASCLMTAAGSETGVLNVTLQLTTTDLLPVSAIVQAASRAWGVEEGDIFIVSATAKHAATESTAQPHARALLQRKLKLHLDFAQMKQENPSLSTLKDFLMSTNQAPETESDIQQLLQAFAEYKQGQLEEQSAEEQHVSASASSDSVNSASASASALHPHLLFLKTGGGATVAQPKHILSMQELQTLADSGSTSEGLLPVQTKKPTPITVSAAARLQHQGPLGSANVVLGTQDDPLHRMASLFAPQKDKAIAEALQILGKDDDEPVSQALFSSLVQDPTDDIMTAVSVPYDKLDQPIADSAGSGSQASDYTPGSDPLNSLSWLDEADLSRSVLAAQQNAVHESRPDTGDMPAPARSVLLSMALRIASTNTSALQAVIGESIAGRRLQQELDKQGFAMVQLDAMFADAGVFSTETEVVSAETADPTQGEAVEQVKVSVRTVVKRSLVPDSATAAHHNTEASQPAVGNEDDLSDDWAPELLICAGGFAAALLVVLLGMYQYSTSRAGKQAQQCLTKKSSTSFWLCGSNSLRQPLIPKHATAEEAC